MRLPAGLDSLEMPLRNAIKQHVMRGHVDVTLQMERDSRSAFEFNADAITSYLAAFQAAAQHAGIAAGPDLNSIFRMPGVVSTDNSVPENDLAALEASITQHAGPLLEKLNVMRAHEGQALSAELRQTMQNLEAAVQLVSGLREQARQSRFERMQLRIAELTQGIIDSDRVLQEAALLADRADVEEEIVRLRTHVPSVP